MNDSDNLVPGDHNHQQVLNQLHEQAKLNRETFRKNAEDTMQAFTLADRDLADALSGEGITADEVLHAWQEKLLPKRAMLEEKRNDQGFKKALQNNLQLSANQAHHKVAGLIDQREQELLDDMVASLYPCKDEKDELAAPREAAIAFFMQSDDEIKAFRDRYFNFAHHLDVADQAGVTVCDPYGSWLERHRCEKQVRKEQRQLEKEEAIRLNTIETKMAELEASQHHLLGNIVTYGWDLAAVDDLKAEFEKKVAKIPKKDRNNPRKRLDVFDKVTHTFRDEATHQRAEKMNITRLKETRKLADETDQLLLHLFDLSDEEHVRLAQQLDEYYSLQNEHQTIEIIQRNRNNR